MNARIRKHNGVALVLGICLVLGLSWAPARGDDLNPPPYRGEPLSVYAHWVGDPAVGLVLESFSAVDDDDPSTSLYPMDPGVSIVAGAAGIYEFQVPNFIDEMPIKYLRLQLTWEGTTLPPRSVITDGYMATGEAVPGFVTSASTPLAYTQPDGGYQYFDIEYRPNPAFERIQVALPPNSVLVQAVVDSISIPEPASLALMAFGGLAFLRQRSR